MCWTSWSSADAQKSPRPGTETRTVDGSSETGTVATAPDGGTMSGAGRVALPAVQNGRPYIVASESAFSS